LFEIQQNDQILKPEAMDKRNLLIIITVVVAFPLLLIQGCKSLAKNIYYSMDCDSFNIDHIELRTGIDIPQIKRNYCELDEMKRTVSFQLLKTGQEKTAYAEKYFKWSKDHLFTNEGSNKQTRWFASLDTLTSELIFELHYK
jgi:hypothetical protein